jgi:hypothetical protein
MCALTFGGRRRGGGAGVGRAIQESVNGGEAIALLSKGIDDDFKGGHGGGAVAAAANNAVVEDHCGARPGR